MALTLCTLLLTVCYMTSLITAAPEPRKNVNNNIGHISKIGNAGHIGGNVGNIGDNGSVGNMGSINYPGHQAPGHWGGIHPPAPQWPRPSWPWNWHPAAPPSHNAYHSQRGLSDPVNSKRQQSDDDVKFVEVEKDPQLLLLEETSDKELVAGLEDGQKFICVDIHCAVWPDNFLVVATTEEQAAEVASEQQAAEVVNEAPAADQAPEQPAKREVSDEVELAARDAAAPLQDDSTTATAVAERIKSQLSEYTGTELMEELSRRLSRRRQKTRQTAAGQKSKTRGGWARYRTKQTVKSGSKAAAPVEA